MKEHSILVIDDSATIRRLCDSELSAAGYRVLLAPTAEQGVETAQNESPDLIILDHQLPGTTGYEVACQLLESPDTARIPVVASSTLRKKAYAEYVDCDNVVDMLPKPYSAEALIATVENAINTAEMVVTSQNEGSAVPEVINELGEADLSGTFRGFSLREIIDMLNNGSKTGILEVESKVARTMIHVSEGRIQAVTASGVNPEFVGKQLPPALSELAPVVKFTVAGRRGSEVDGLVELLNNKVLDPRLLKKLLRLQAAILVRACFRSELKSFRFMQCKQLPPLFQKLPLSGSLLGLLVEGALICAYDEVPRVGEGNGIVRRSIRGQNLDRAGLSSRHMRLMSMLAEPVTPDRLAAQLDWPTEEVDRVLHGFELAELIEKCRVSSAKRVFAVISDSTLSQTIQRYFKADPDFVKGRIVRDTLALRLLLRRSKPHAIVLDFQDETVVEYINENRDSLGGIQVIGFHGDEPVLNDDIVWLERDVEFAGIAEALELPRPMLIPSEADLDSQPTSTFETAANLQRNETP